MPGSQASDGPRSTAAEFTDALLSLGFSHYEARCYVGLLAPEPQTGYAVSKTTGVPQPKVYEALRKLVSRGAARQLSGEPVRFVPVPPAKLLDDLRDSFEERVEQARVASVDLEAPAQALPHEPVAALGDRNEVLAAARRALRAAARRVYLSGTAPELTTLTDDILACAGRGVDVVALTFGKVRLEAPGVRVFRHQSTEGVVFRHHQARHVALVSDSRETMFGLAADGRTWSGISTSSEPIIAAVKGYIRHDIDMQQVFADFGTELVQAYGPGLQGLEGYRADAAGRTGAGAEDSDAATA
jgi:HTH-type transcriptional regulator, sugar sensing transcriptional regulator